MKAMILAAGRGNRLRPLTDKLPKPLVKVGQYSLIEHQIHALKQAGVVEIVINVCYLGEMIQSYLGDGERYGVSIQYSVESPPAALETGGGIIKALPLLGNAPFIVTSADLYTGFCYQHLLDKDAHLAYLVMVENPTYNQQGDFSLTAAGCLSLDAPSLTYAGIAVLHPALFANESVKRVSLAAILRPAISRGAVYGEVFTGCWYNVGTQEELAHCQRANAVSNQ